MLAAARDCNEDIRYRPNRRPRTEMRATLAMSWRLRQVLNPGAPWARTDSESARESRVDLRVRAPFCANAGDDAAVGEAWLRQQCQAAVTGGGRRRTRRAATGTSQRPRPRRPIFGTRSHDL